MKRELNRILALTAILLIASGMMQLHTTTASKTLTVPDQYPTIGAAVEAAASGDTVLVKSGAYYENIQVDKPLTLEGQTAQTR